MGYVCMAYLSLGLTGIFHLTLDKPEAIYLAAFISILFYVLFVIIGFCIQSLLKLTGLSIALCLLFFFVTRMVSYA
ncbi:hypothetical protein CVD09_12770 [Acinetobacter seifertii]|nr:hypothetical protein CVD09_12770 [Acinetobacter seifertii]